MTEGANSAERDTNLRRLTLIRVGIATALLVPVLYAQAQVGSQLDLNTGYAVIGLLYASAVLFATLLRLRPAWSWLVATQLTVDVFLATALVYVFGGVRSPFVVLYLVIAFGAGLMTARQTALGIGVLTGVAYGLMGHMAAAGWLPSWQLDVVTRGGEVGPPELYLRLFSILLSSALVAALSAGARERLYRMTGELRRERAALEALQQLNHQLLAGMSSGLLATDGAGTVIACNRAAERITGLPQAQIIGASAFALMGLEAMSPADIDERLRHRQIARLERSLRTPAGETRVVGMSITKVQESLPTDPSGAWAVRSEGPIVGGYIVMFQDLTDLKRMERMFWMRERMAVLGEMAGSLAHEIRNPLASISGSLQVLRGRAVAGQDPQAERLMHIVTRESERLSRIIEDFLEYARPTKLEAAEHDLVALATDTVELLRNSPELRPDHTLEVVAETPAVRAFVDPARVRQVFWNLARNAIQAMPEGGGLCIGLRQTDEGAEVVFEDRGSGMSREQVDRLFRPFASGSAGGTGLGLAVVYRILEMHGARAEVESEPGKGTRFVLRFHDGRVPGDGAVVVIDGQAEIDGRQFDELSRSLQEKAGL